jgi:ABC-type phosphate/phosphonate transport system substrate-binding protein
MRRHQLTIPALCLALMLAAPIAALAHPHGAEPIIFGIAPQQEPEKVRAMWAPMFSYLEREVGHAFAFETAPSIEEFQKRVLEGRYDMWWGNPLTYVQASKRLGYTAIARDTTRIAGLLVTLKEDGAKSPKELLGKKIAYSAPDAIGGTLLVQALIARAGVAPDQVETIYTGSHQSAYQAVLDGKAAAAGGVPRSFNALDAAQSRSSSCSRERRRSRRSPLRCIRGSTGASSPRSSGPSSSSTGRRKGRTSWRPSSTRRSLYRTTSTTTSTATSPRG